MSRLTRLHRLLRYRFMAQVVVTAQSELVEEIPHCTMKVLALSSSLRYTSKCLGQPLLAWRVCGKPVRACGNRSRHGGDRRESSRLRHFAAGEGDEDAQTFRAFYIWRATRAPEPPSVGHMSWPPRIGELLPRAADAYGVREKLIGYSLDWAHKDGGPKARGFEQILGITISDVDYLEARIRVGIVARRSGMCG